MQWGLQTPGVLKQPRDPQGVVWGPAPSSLGAPAGSSDSAACLGSPLPASASVSPSVFPCQGFGGDVVPGQQCQQSRQLGTWPDRDGGRSAAWAQEMAPCTDAAEAHVCLFPLLAESVPARDGAGGLAAPRSC